MIRPLTKSTLGKRAPSSSTSQANERKRRRDSETPPPPALGDKRRPPTNQLSTEIKAKIKILSPKEIKALGLNTKDKNVLNALLKSNLVQPKKTQQNPNLLSNEIKLLTSATSKHDDSIIARSSSTMSTNIVSAMEKSTDDSADNSLRQIKIPTINPNNFNKNESIGITIVNNDDNDEMQDLNKFATSNKFDALNDVPDVLNIKEVSNNHMKDILSSSQIDGDNPHNKSYNPFLEEDVNTSTSSKGSRCSHNSVPDDQQHPANRSKQKASRRGKIYNTKRLQSSGAHKFRSSMPPIYIYNGKITEFTKLIRDSIPENSFAIKNLSHNKFALMVSNLMEFKSILKILKEKNIEFFTRTPKEERIPSLILRGISHDFLEEELLLEINKLKLENVEISKIKKINTKIFFNARSGGNAFLIQLTHNSNIQSLTSVAVLANQMVTWGKIQRRGPIQCFNCQRFGHISRYCNRVYRCVKCNNDHNPGECALSADENGFNENVFCVGCGQTGHPASYRGCPKYKEKIDQFKKNITAADEKRRNILRKVTNFVSPEKSYARATSPTKPISEGKEVEPTAMGGVPSQSVDALARVGSILDAFKDSILDAMKVQLSDIKKQVTVNSERIDQIFCLLENNNNGSK